MHKNSKLLREIDSVQVTVEHSTLSVSTQHRLAAGFSGVFQWVKNYIYIQLFLVFRTETYLTRIIMQILITS